MNPLKQKSKMVNRTELQLNHFHADVSGRHSSSEQACNINKTLAKSTQLSFKQNLHAPNQFEMFTVLHTLAQRQV